MWNKLLILFLFISSFAEGQFLQRSNAPKDSLIQHIFDKRGREIYQDTSGINIQNVWFAPDNGQGKKHRPIQKGRIYNFTGIETITYPQSITTIIDQDGNDLSSFLVGQVLTPGIDSISKIIINGTDVYNCDEQLGFISYQNIFNGNHASLNLGGSSEISFHATNHSLPSIQNEIGFSKAGYFDAARYLNLGYHSEFELQNFTYKYKGILTANNVIIGTINQRQEPSLNSGVSFYLTIGNELRIILTQNASTSIGYTYGTISIELNKFIDLEIEKNGTQLKVTLNGQVETKTVILSIFYQLGNSNTRVGAYSVNTGSLLRAEGYYYTIQLIDDDLLKELINLNYINGNETSVQNIAEFAPINSDAIWSPTDDGKYTHIPIAGNGKGNIDISGNIVPKVYHGPVRYETTIEPILLVPDGIIKLTHFDLSGITITSSQGTSTPSKSGNDILLTSGNLRELILSNNDRYQFSEFTGDTIFNTVNLDHLLIDLNGSAINPFGNDTSAYPYNQLNGYWSNSSDTVKAPIETDFYNILIPGSPKVINNSGDVYDRNFADAPALESANVHIDENITFDSITADLTRFYRNSETGIVRDLIVNSNFPEPISGSSNLRNRIRNYIQRTDEIYNFSGIEKVTIPDVPDFERTSTFYLKASIQRTGDDAFEGVIWNSYIDSAGDLIGLRIVLNNSGPNAKKLLVSLEGVGVGQDIFILSSPVFELGIRYTIEVFYDGSSDDTGISLKIDGQFVTPESSFGTLTSNVSTGNGFATGKLKGIVTDVGGIIISQIEWDMDGTNYFKTECADNGDLTCVDLSGQGNDGTVDLDTTPRQDFFITE
jgi:hypothetical protein